MGKEIELLKDHACLPPHFMLYYTFGGNLHAIDPNLAAVRHLQQVYTAEQSALAGTAGADEDYNLSPADGDGNPLKDVIISEGLFQID
jgi:hypothetical protein